jgi:hypothetical protein
MSFWASAAHGAASSMVRRPAPARQTTRSLSATEGCAGCSTKAAGCCSGTAASVVLPKLVVAGISDISFVLALMALSARAGANIAGLMLALIAQYQFAVASAAAHYSRSVGFGHVAAFTQCFDEMCSLPVFDPRAGNVFLVIVNVET